MPIGDVDQRELARLSKELELVNKEIDELGSKIAVEYHPYTRQQFKEQLDAAKAKRNSLIQKIRIKTADGLYSKLLGINYYDHIDAFRDCAPEQSVSAFVIHGPDQYGHYWLLKRLKDLIWREHIDAKEITFDFNNRILTRNICAVWNALAKDLESPDAAVREIPHISVETSQAETERCFDAVARRIAVVLQTKCVLMIFRNVDYLAPIQIPYLIDDFWLPLATRVQVHLGESIENKLIMFLVYYDHIAGSWPLSLPRAPGAAPETCGAMQLPVLPLFSAENVRDAMRSTRDWLPRVTQIDAEVPRILQQSGNGVPERVAKEIFRRCGAKYEGDDRWLTIV